MIIIVPLLIDLIRRRHRRKHRAAAHDRGDVLVQQSTYAIPYAG